MPPSRPSAAEPGWVGPEQIAAFTAAGTTMHRLFSGPGGWIERLGRDLLISCSSPETLASLLVELEGRKSRLALPIDRIFLRKRWERQGSPKLTLLSGDPSLPMETAAQESGLAYRLRFDAGESTGFFLDQRENRSFLRKKKPLRLLNLFAYTCSFGVAAASAGAQTWNVDLSPRVLEWGKENYRLNGLDPNAHWFLARDARAIVPYLLRRKVRFDACVIDPPTYAHGRKGGDFSLPRDLAGLLSGLFPLCEPGALLLLSTNFGPWHPDDLFREGSRAGERAGAKVEPLPPLPHPADLPEGTGPATLWLRISPRT
ncbi:class I SAM-dependent methyltransferase [Methylacidimicrobium sp. B4]|uniref:class I SAM-dependent methyltransferase n=1 Tax=Methylacidimicrobium sp. B4 TaxID=2796139 RepID=UPI001A8F3050|nr:class I SAM-dependent methyltransferase [Methylacidimicrobium sp. B4]QSR84189.1 class I SAM-dependent methyltransferase [Methylacidimicrobium sp. B4]